MTTVTVERQTALRLADDALLRAAAYIDGGWLPAGPAKTMAVVDLATGEVIGQVPRFGADETRRAIEAAERAFEPWRAATAKERSALLRRWFDLVLAH